MTTNIRYEIDPYNRLVIAGRGLSLPKQRRVLEGRFAVSRSNSLEYQVKSSASESETSPYQVKLKGSWYLSPRHELIFSVKKSSGGALGNSLVLSGNIIEAKGSSILFALTTKRGKDIRTTYALELAGSWAIDRDNRLVFKVERSSGVYDPLVFEAGWEVGANNEIVYRYERTQLKTRLKTSHTIILKGAWKMGESGSLNYEIDAASGEPISFKAALSGCGKDHVTYEIGASVAGRIRPKTRKIALYGSWRIKRGSGLFFDIESSSGRVSSISFTAEAKLTSADTMLLTIKDDLDKRYLGIRFELNHTFLKGDGNAFIRAIRSLEGSSVLLGAGFRW